MRAETSGLEAAIVTAVAARRHAHTLTMDAARMLPLAAANPHERIEAGGDARRARAGRGFRHGWRGIETAHLTNEPPRRDP
jgi:hypothetical protein